MRNILKKILFVLLFFQNVAMLFGQERIENLRTILEVCGNLEYKAYKLESKEKDQLLTECQTNMLKVYDIVEKWEPLEIEKNKVFYVKVCQRACWYLMNSSNNDSAMTLFKYMETLDKAIKIEPNNFLTYYLLAMASKNASLSWYQTYLLKAFELNPNSPEVNFELGFCFYNTSREPELVAKHQKLFFDNKKNFLPELHHFDTGYPNLNLLKYEPENEAEAEMLKRIEVYKPDDKSRFQIK